MPGQFGNATETEVYQALQSGKRARLASAQGPNERRAVNMQMFGRALFGGIDPRMMKAEEIATGLQRGSQLRREGSETAIDFSIRQHRVMQDDMRLVDATTHAQISAQLIVLEKERDNLVNLQATRERAGRRDELQMTKLRYDNIAAGRNYVVDDDTHQSIGSVDLTDDDAQEQLQTMANSVENGLILTIDQYLGDGYREEWQKNYNASEFPVQEMVSKDARRQMLTSNTVMQLILESIHDNQNPISPAAQLQQWATRQAGSLNQFALDTGYSSIGSQLNDSDAGATNLNDAADRYWNNQSQAGRTIVTKQAMTNLAYALARSVNQRVTDKDFELAWSLLGGDGGSMQGVVNALAQLRDDSWDMPGLTVRNLISVDGLLPPPQRQGLSLLNDQYEETYNQGGVLLDQILAATGMELQTRKASEARTIADAEAREAAANAGPSPFAQALVSPAGIQ